MNTDGTTNDLYPGLTEKEKLLVMFIEDRNNWRPPSYRECANALGLKDTKSIYNYLEQLKKKGYYYPSRPHQILL